MTAGRFPDLLPDRPTTGAGSPKTDHLQDGAGARIPSPATHFVPSILRRAGMAVTSPVTRASGAPLEPVGQNEHEDDGKIPKFLRRHGVGAAHAQPVASDWEPSEGPQADQRSGFLPRILREAMAVTPPITPWQAPVAASVTPAATAVPIVGSICPTCQCRVPARLSAADRQRAYRARKRERGQCLAKSD